MVVINRLASQLGQKDEVFNIVLAHELATEKNDAGIEEIVKNLTNKNKKIQSDCIKVLYEIGRVNPELISKYSLTFIELLKGYNNRLVWGAMQALSTIAEFTPSTIMPNLRTLKHAIKTGSVITVDKGILTLSKLAKTNKEYNDEIFPFLIDHLQNCRTKEVPQHAESTLFAVTNYNKEEFLRILNKREKYLTAAQLKRIQKIYKNLGV